MTKTTPTVELVLAGIAALILIVGLFTGHATISIPATIAAMTCVVAAAMFPVTTRLGKTRNNVAAVVGAIVFAGIFVLYGASSAWLLVVAFVGLAVAISCGFNLMRGRFR